MVKNKKVTKKKYEKREINIEGINIVKEKTKKVLPTRKYNFGYRNWTDKIIEKGILDLTFSNIKAVKVIINNQHLLSETEFIKMFDNNIYDNLSFSKIYQVSKNKLFEITNFKFPLEMLRNIDVTIVYREKQSMNYWVYVLSKYGIAGKKEDAENFVQTLEQLEVKRRKDKILE